MTRASFISSALCPPRKWTSFRNRVLRSTSVPMAERLPPHDQVAFPVAGDTAVGDLARAFTDHCHRPSKAGPTFLGPAAALAPGPPGAQDLGRVTVQPARVLLVERLVVRLMAGPHVRAVREITGQCLAYLLGAPVLV
jgi:hypothetical protein